VEKMMMNKGKIKLGKSGNKISLVTQMKIEEEKNLKRNINNRPNNISSASNNSSDDIMMHLAIINSFQNFND
jgi:hypothetical protein